jgi:hypothetical protein
MLQGCQHIGLEAEQPEKSEKQKSNSTRPPDDAIAF